MSISEFQNNLLLRSSWLPSGAMSNRLPLTARLQERALRRAKPEEPPHRVVNQRSAWRNPVRLTDVTSTSAWESSVQFTDAPSPQQNALVRRAPDLDGRFHTPEYEALPTVQAEIVDEAHGNNSGCRTQRSTSFVGGTRIMSRAFELQEQKSTGVFAKDIGILLAQRQRRDKKILQGHRSISRHRNQERQ